MPRVGRYEIVRELGRGGMGIVYLAQDTLLKRQVAIKTLLPPPDEAPAARDNLVRRFIREAEAAAALSHPNLVAIYDIVADGDTTSIVMEFVNGKTLAEVAPLGTRLEPAFLLGILRQCAGALDHAHSRGIVHRDIKPANIMLDEVGSVKIADFGIAKLLNSNTDLTHGFTLGTLEYMSPEQLEGRPVAGASDQYSLAVVAYRMLTGGRIFEGDVDRSWLVQILRNAPVPASQRNPTLPDAVDAVFSQGLEKAPDARYGSCSEFVRALGEALVVPVRQPAMHEPRILESRGHESTVVEAPRPRRELTILEPRKPRSRLPGWKIGVAAAVVAATVVFTVLERHPTTSPPPPAGEGKKTVPPTPPASPTSPAPQPVVNSQVVRGAGENSLWQCTGDAYNGYLRFYSDGTVIGVSSPSTPAELASWFKAPYEDSGKYSISGSSLKFSLKDSEGTVDYDGVIEDSSLQLNVFSRINDHRSTCRYHLVVEKFKGKLQKTENAMTKKGQHTNSRRKPDGH